MLLFSYRPLLRHKNSNSTSSYDTFLICAETNDFCLSDSKFSKYLGAYRLSGSCLWALLKPDPSTKLLPINNFPTKLPSTKSHRGLN